MTTPVMATNMELEAFEEICEITGEIKKGVRYVPVEVSVESVVEEVQLQE